jgi:hypothetical protein
MLRIRAARAVRAWPRWLRRAVQSTAVLLCVVPAGCQVSVGPSGVWGLYGLERVGESSLPAVIYSDEFIVFTILADTLEFEADCRGRRITVQAAEYLQPGGSPGHETRSEAAFTCRSVGGRIEISFVCPPEASCIAPPHMRARQIPGGLQVDVLYAPQGTYYYTRLRLP